MTTRSADMSADRPELHGVHFAGLAFGVACHMSLMAAGIVQDRPSLILGGMVAMLLTGSWMFLAARRSATVVSRVALGTTASASGWYVVGLGGAIWAAAEASWPLVASVSVLAATGYALAGRRWMRADRSRQSADCERVIRRR